MYAAMGPGDGARNRSGRPDDECTRAADNRMVTRQGEAPHEKAPGRRAGSDRAEPGSRVRGSSTDAALALGAFAVFNQMLSGIGVFGGLAHQPVVVAPAPPLTIYQPAPVVYAPPPVVYAPPPVVYAPPPPVVVVRSAPVVFVPRGGYYVPRGGYYAPAPVYRHAPRPVPIARDWCPPGHMKHGRCY